MNKRDHKPTPATTETWWQVASSIDTRLFPLPVLAWARQRPAEGQTGFESTNGVGGNSGEGMKEAWEMDNRGLCVGNTVTSRQTEGERERKRGVWCIKRQKQSLMWDEFWLYKQIISMTVVDWRVELKPKPDFQRKKGCIKLRFF